MPSQPMSDSRVAYLPLLALLVAMTALPLALLILTSLIPGGASPLDPDSTFGFKNYQEVFLDPWTYRLLGNTFLFAGGSLLLGMTIAVAMGWLVERTDMPLKNFAFIAIVLPMAMPSFITAIGWTYLLNPANGMINVLVRNLFAPELDYGPFNIYSLGGMIMLGGLGMAPSMFIILSSMMRNLDPSFEESAYSSGASSSTIMTRIVIPLLRPGLLSVLIYFFVTAIEMLEIPLVFGTNAKFDVLSVTIFRRTAGTQGTLPDYGLASTYAIIGLAIGGSLLLIYFRLMRQSDRFAIISGKGYRPKQYQLSPYAKWIAISFLALFVLLKLILPLLVLLWSSLLPYFQMPSISAFTALTFKNYIALFKLSRFLDAAINTSILMVMTAMICMGLAAIVSWVVVRGNGLMARMVDVLAFLPHLVPGLIIALALLLTSVGTPLYGTLSVLIIGNTIRYLPFGVRMMSSVMYQVSRELEEAALMSGASQLVAFKRVILPLVLPAFTNGLVWVGSHAMKDMTLPLFLASSSNIVIGGLMWETWNRGASELTAAISVLLVAILLCITVPTQFLTQRKMRRLDSTFREGL